MSIEKKEKRKIVFKTVALILIVEIILGIVGVGVIYAFYDKISKTSSGKSEKIINKNIKLKEINFETSEKGKIEEKENGLVYAGKLGKIEIKEEEDFGFENGKGNYIKNKNVDIDLNNYQIQKQLVLNFLENKGLLDKYIYSYFNTKTINDVNKEFLNLINYGIIIKALKKEDADKLIKEYKIYSDNTFSQIEELLKERKFKKLAEYLRSLENELNLQNIKDNVFGNTGLIKDERFQYVINKLYDPKYYKNIKKVAKIIPNVDENLIISAIAVEQLRFLATDRGYAKNLIKNNKFLTNFTKFSYGLGGIKTNTFNNINHWIKIYNRPLYDNYFRNFVGQVIKVKEPEITNVENNGTTPGSIMKDGQQTQQHTKPKENKIEFDEVKIKKILENHYNGTLYVGALLYTIKERRKRNGFSIDDNPGVILTLYNFGNLKTPHSNPGIGGSYIKINGDNEKYYFGEIGLAFYNYIKYYLQNK